MFDRKKPSKVSIYHGVASSKTEKLVCSICLMLMFDALHVISVLPIHVDFPCKRCDQFFSYIRSPLSTASSI